MREVTREDVLAYMDDVQQYWPDGPPPPTAEAAALARRLLHFTSPGSVPGP